MEKRYKFVLIGLTVVFIISSTALGFSLLQRQESRRELDNLAKAVESEELPRESKQEADKRRLDNYQKLKEENKDFIGWISIEGTSLSYPVMYTPKSPEFYLRKDFSKQYSNYGIPFLSEKCGEDLAEDNIIIYGHYVKNGDMFGVLEKYKDEKYFESHKYVNFDTVSTLGKYEVMAVFVTEDSKMGFPYYEFIETSDEKEYDRYVKNVKMLSIYDTQVDSVYGQQILTLSTCDYSKKNGRLVVVARKTAI